MNAMKFIAPLFGALILFSCKKDNDTAKNDDGKDSVVTPVTHDSLIVTKTRFWNSSVDTASSTPAIDSIIYLKDSITIDKIITTFSNADAITSSYTYNTKGKITQVKVRNEGISTGLYNWDYNFYYNTDGTQIDSFQMIFITNKDTTTGYLTYNDKHQLTTMDTYFTQDGATTPWMTTQYNRNTGGYIDTIKQNWLGAPNQVIVLNAPVAADSSLQFQPALKWWMGTRISAYPLAASTVTLMTQQFFMDENILRSGIVLKNGTPSNLTIKHAVDASGAMNFFSVGTAGGNVYTNYTLTLQNEHKTY